MKHDLQRPSPDARHATYYCADCDHHQGVLEQLEAHTPTHRANVMAVTR